MPVAKPLFLFFFTHLVVGFINDVGQHGPRDEVARRQQDAAQRNDFVQDVDIRVRVQKQIRDAQRQRALGDRG